jgi:hypothetical protein
LARPSETPMTPVLVEEIQPKRVENHLP